MALSITHSFVSAIPDGADATLVRPSDWNDSHALAGFGTGVETALAVNVGSAGAFVTFNGALGTPSSGTLTNCTGLPVAGGGTGLAVGTSGAVPYFNATTTMASSALLAQYGVITGGGAGAAPYTTSGFTFGAATGEGLVYAAGTATTDVAAFSLTRTNNNAAVATGVKWTFTDTTSAAGFLPFQILGTSTGAANLFSVDKSGNISVPLLSTISTSGGSTITFGAFNGDILFSSRFAVDSNNARFTSSANYAVAWSSANAPITTASAVDTQVARAGAANSLVFSGATFGAGSATSRTEINKAVTAFTDAAAKTVFTLTIPNAAHSASYLVRLTGSIGAGGAIGANEASATNCYVVTICRTAGVNAVGTISAAFGAAAANVAGATTVTCTGALAAVSGGVGAVNTIDIQATITKAGGASDNHTCVATASLLNANATGITIA